MKNMKLKFGLRKYQHKKIKKKISAYVVPVTNDPVTRSFHPGNSVKGWKAH